MVSTIETAKPDLEALLRQWDAFITSLAGRYARSIGADPDDVRGEILLAICQQFSRFDPERAGFSTWLGFVALNVYGNLAPKHVRRVRRERQVYTDTDPRLGFESVPLVDQAADHKAADPFDVAARREEEDSLAAVVSTALEALSGPQLAAVRARFWDGSAGLCSTGRRHLTEARAVLHERLQGADRTSEATGRTLTNLNLKP